jgi:hypothetical protein
MSAPIDIRIDSPNYGQTNIPRGGFTAFGVYFVPAVGQVLQVTGFVRNQDGTIAYGNPIATAPPGWQVQFPFGGTPLTQGAATVHIRLTWTEQGGGPVHVDHECVPIAIN